jgi:hypothetical protein
MRVCVCVCVRVCVWLGAVQRQTTSSPPTHNSAHRHALRGHDGVAHEDGLRVIRHLVIKAERRGARAGTLRACARTRHVSQPGCESAARAGG